MMIVKKTIKRMRGITTVLAIAIIGSLLISSQSHVFAYDSASNWKDIFDDFLDMGDTGTYNYGWTDLADDAYTAQNGVYTLDALRRMYEVTGDTDYLEKLSTYIDNMYSYLDDIDGDGFLGFGTTYYNPQNEYEEYLLHRGMIVYQWAKFIQLVRADSGVASSTNPQSITYGAQADALESVINSDLIPRFNSSWSNQYNVYLDNLNPGHSLPYNQYLAMAAALYEMAKIDMDAYKHYLTWADTMSAQWKYWLTLDGAGYHWNYWDHLTPSDDQTLYLEDWSHTTIDFMLAQSNYSRGGTFNSTAMTKLADTIYDNMWNGNSTTPLLSMYVDGSGSDVGKFTLDIGDMERWAPGIWALFEKEASLRNYEELFSSRYLNDIAILYQLHPDHSTPASFSLSKPANSATNQNLDLAFAWKPSVNAADYRLQVSTASNFATLTADIPNIVGTSAMLTGNVLSPSTTYYWRVIARNGYGTTTTSGAYSFTTGPNKTYTMSFKHYDNRTGGLSGYHFKQVLIDGVVVWDMDVTADAANSWLSASFDVTPYLTGKSSVNLELRLYDKVAVSNYTVDVIWDDIAITNTEILNSGFESNPDWYYSESISPFTGTLTAIAYSGSNAFKLHLPTDTATVAGDYAKIKQKISVIR